MPVNIAYDGRLVALSSMAGIGVRFGGGLILDAQGAGHIGAKIVAFLGI
jgi:hypothetical protein